MHGCSDKLGMRLIEAMRGLEQWAFLDGPVRRISGGVDSALSPAWLRHALRGVWLGHPFHPLLTDFTEGAWMAATFLDLFGPPGSSPAARRLLAFGMLTTVPTYLSGLVEWVETQRDEEGRVGVVHLAAISVAIGLYGASYIARRRGGRRSATLLGLGGGVVALAEVSSPWPTDT